MKIVANIIAIDPQIACMTGLGRVCIKSAVPKRLPRFVPGTVCPSRQIDRDAAEETRAKIRAKSLIFTTIIIVVIIFILKMQTRYYHNEESVKLFYA